MQIKEKHSEGTYIFVIPPSMEVLQQRLEERMTDSSGGNRKKAQTVCCGNKNVSGDMIML